ALTPQKQSRLKQLEELGCSVFYLQADVSDLEAIKIGLKKEKEHVGPISGVIHAAGIKESKTIVEKDFKEFQEVIDPKVKGTLVLDEVLLDEPLEFICYFSSSAAILGDFGACDYAVGNRFEMAYAHYRSALKVQGERSGKAIVINWPFWKEGGMQVGTSEQADFYLRSSGQQYLTTAEGFKIFEKILCQQQTQHLVLIGEPSRVHRFLRLTDHPLRTDNPAPVSPSFTKGKKRPEMRGLSVAECLEWDIKDHVSRLLEIPHESVDATHNLADYGFESISLAEFARILSDHYGFEVTPALFFGHSTIEKLKSYFLKEHATSIAEFYQATQEKSAVHLPSSVIDQPKRAHIQPVHSVNNRLNPSLEAIAIIGMSGRFPQARSIKEMWEILSAGKDAVEEIPEDRFDWRQYDRELHYKWSGLIPGIDEFDPLFFEISPRDAENMDPRQRHLLQESWKALEDAGYGASQIRQHTIGMFVGVEEGGYGCPKEGNITANHNGILAARIAYFLDLHGPAMAINTACSSGLVAVHQAILSLRIGECSTAIAAGVNLMFSPAPYVAMRQAGMLSTDGKCFAFDQRANGMVPGEAVAVVILKKLSDAESDKDPIHAIIRGSGVNYDGKTNGITAPSGVSQTALLKSVYHTHHIDPEEIDYIVTHGTGTKLGDPVEINALNDAFKEQTQKQNYCALTSTKSQFGHTFAASGLVSLISLVEAIKHESIPGSLHCEKENDYIRWKQSPFYVNKSTKAWPKHETNKRIGGVSAFGMSGTNAHMIVESYSCHEKKRRKTFPYYLLPLSAKTPEALTEKIHDMLKALQSIKGENERLTATSYTLQVGRHHFSHRCAIVIEDLEDAVYVYNKVKGGERPSNVFQGTVRLEVNGQKIIEQSITDLLIKSRSLEKDPTTYREILCALADFYCQGYDISWDLLYGEEKPRRIPAPTYPFAREHYWIKAQDTKVNGLVQSSSRGHFNPLLQENTSTLSQQCYRSTFTGEEFFLNDHRVKGEKILPGAAYLEMAYEGVKRSCEMADGQRQTVRLNNMVWAQPIVVGDSPIDVKMRLFLEKNGEINYEIFTGRSNESEEMIVHSQGVAVRKTIGEMPSLNLADLKKKLNQHRLDPEECYAVFKKMGIDYGPSHKALKEIYTGDRETLAKLILPASIKETAGQFTLHPSLVDAAFQASVGLGISSRHHLQPSVPFALKSLEVLDRCQETMWAWVRLAEDSATEEKIQQLTIDLCDDRGNICVQMEGFSLRVLTGELHERKRTTVSKEGIETPRDLVTKSPRTNAVSETDRQIGQTVPSTIDVTDQMVKDHVRTILKESIAAFLKIEERSIQNDRSFSEYGVDSIVAVELINQINKRCEIVLQTTVLFDYNNLDQLTKHIVEEYQSELISSLRKGRFPVNDQQQEKEERSDAKGMSFCHDPMISTSQTTYHRLEIEGPGKIEDLKVVEAKVPELKANEVRVSVRSFSLNLGDLLCVKGLYPTMPPYPFTPGFEAAGIIVAVGSAVNSVRCGDAVIAMMGESLGAHSTMITCLEEQVFLKPSALSLEEASALSVVSLTMIDVFHKANMKPEEKVLIQTATGGTGLIAVQLAKHYGVEIYATAGSARKLDYLKKLGVHHRINYRETDFEEEIKRLTKGRGVDVVINTLPGDAMQKGMNCLSSGGRYIELAMTALKSAKTMDLSVLGSNQSFYSVDLRKMGLEHPEKIQQYFQEMMTMVQQGVIYPTICKVFPFDQMKDAYRHMENRDNIGKVVVSIPVNSQLPEAKRKAQLTPLGRARQSVSLLQGPIAVIGMSGRFAQSETIKDFWDCLSKGTDMVQEATRWDLSQYYSDPSQDEKKYCSRGSFLNHIDQFDSLFFKISPVEATYMDPQQRLFLEESWKALEDAGYAGESIQGKRCGIYVGSSGSDYPQLFSHQPPAQAFWSNAGSIIPARIAYYLNLQGPAVTIDTACSSSLVAVHMACQSLWTKETEMALAGGVFIQTTPAFYLAANEAGMLSPTGSCHVFDEQADGFVPGEGVGVVVLKRLEDAVSDGDHIYGVIRGSGLNQDGTTNGITAPSAESQERLEKEVYDRFHINPENIQMIEAHGTGTKLGDPIEFAALSRAFRSYTNKKGYCTIGSVKTNIGHLAAAAGVASIVKVLLSLKYKKIPPSLQFKKANAAIRFENSPFFVNTELRNWEIKENTKRQAAVSSFGFSGTNAHLVIEEGPQTERRHPENPGYLIVFSARSSEQLKVHVNNMLNHCKEEKGLDLGNMSYTLLHGRKHWNHRLACVVRSLRELIEYLEKWLEKGEVLQVYTSSLAEGDIREQASLKSYGNQCLEECRKMDNAVRYLEHLSTIAELYTQGYKLTFQKLFVDGYSKLSLPTYPFKRERYWVETQVPTRQETLGGAKSDLNRHSPARLKENRSDKVFQQGTMGLITMSPVWDVVPVVKMKSLSEKPMQMIIIGGIQRQIKAIKTLYPQAKPINIGIHSHVDDVIEQLGKQNVSHLVWIAPHSDLHSLGSEEIIRAQHSGVLQVFHLIKALLALGYGTKKLAWTVVTTATQGVYRDEQVNPTHASVHGLIGSLAKEYPHWKIRLLDMQAHMDWPVEEMFRLPYDAQGNALAYRNKEWFGRVLLPVNELPVQKEHGKRGGVYVVIGGAGGIGEAWSKWMLKKYRAKIVWIGRREKDAAIQKKLDLLSTMGPAPTYIQADATNLSSLQSAYVQIKQQHGHVHGVIHSAIVLLDSTLAHMNEERFKRGLQAKLDVSVCLAKVFEKEALDFVLFFSSMSAFTKAPGQSNYAAGCTFKDAFGHQLAKDWPCAVKVMNWGYWGSVGIVADQSYQDQMRKMGIGSIEPKEGMEMLDKLLNGPLHQLALIKQLKKDVMEETQ
ncbi:MAG: SDR family NAD(P)-dependent oxidoreductase, partial [Waddliaceae bacterium]